MLYDWTDAPYNGPRRAYGTIEHVGQNVPFQSRKSSSSEGMDYGSGKIAR